MTPHTKRKMIHYWRRQVRPILVLVLVFTSFRSTFADWNDVPTGSMKPTIIEGDRIYVNKLAYGLKFPYTTWHLAKWSAPQRGDIVVFYSPEPSGIRLVKRVVGLPGDRISITNGELTINGKTLGYTPISPDDAPVMPGVGHGDRLRFYTEQLGDHPHVIVLNDSRPSKRNVAEFTVPDGHYFMMGDNRDNSRDCRYFGPNDTVGFVERTEILGRSSRTIFSLDYNDAYLPRKNRFFHGLQ